MTDTGFYYGYEAVNGPSDQIYTLFVIKYSAHWITQLFMCMDRTMYIRAFTSGTTWGKWQRFVSETDYKDEVIETRTSGNYTSKGKLYYSSPCLLMLAGFNGDMTTNNCLYYVTMNYDGTMTASKVFGTNGVQPTITMNSDKTLTISYQHHWGGKIIWGM